MIVSQWRNDVFAAIEKRDHQQLKKLLLQLRALREIIKDLEEK